MVERAVALDANNAEYKTEVGYELLLQNKPRDAMKYYRSAMKLDETSVTALTGQTGDSSITPCVNLMEMGLKAGFIHLRAHIRRELMCQKQQFLMN